jgi:hypothetical protein
VTYVGGPISANTTWSLANSPYHVTNHLTVNSGVTLTIDPGVVVKMGYTSGRPRRRFFVNGVLDAQGTSGNPIIFTSERDDTHGGDSNGDLAATTPATTDWGYVKISGTGSTIQYCQFWYGGYEPYNKYHYMLWINGANPVVSRCTFNKAYSIALYIQGTSINSSILLSANSFTACPTGISYDGGTLPGITGRIYGNSFSTGAVAIAVSRVGNSLTVQHNNFSQFTSYGVQNTDTTRTVDAQGNWWGASSGPGGIAGGGGVPVSSYVTYANWWTTPNQTTDGVWNVIAIRQAGTMIVDIYYDLVGSAPSYNVSIEASKTGGSPYTFIVPAAALSGARGSGVTPGVNKHVVWDSTVGNTGPYTDQMKVKVTADLE